MTEILKQKKFDLVKACFDSLPDGKKLSSKEIRDILATSGHTIIPLTLESRLAVLCTPKKDAGGTVTEKAFLACSGQGKKALYWRT